MKIKIAIADTNETYARRLFEALQRQENLSLSVFTDKKRMESDLSSTRYDIILFDYSMYSGDGIFKNAKLSVLLYDEEAEQPYIGTGKYKVVKKYQRGSSIYKEVIGLYSEFVSDSVFFGRSGEQCRVLCVYSPAGGVGKTTVSMAIANTIANMGRNVMYLNFEPIPAYGSFMPLKGEKGMGALLAAIDGNGSFSLKLESLMKKTLQGIIYFEKFENLLDIYELTAEDVEKLIRMISETVKADFIIVDMGTQYDAVNRSIMDISDKIVFVERNDSIAEEKIRAFAAHPTVIREYADKICSVINFSESNSDKSAAKYEVAGRIPEKKTDADKLAAHISRYSLIDVDMLIS